MVMLGKICANFHETFHSRKKKKKGKREGVEGDCISLLNDCTLCFRRKISMANILLEKVTRFYFCEKTSIDGQIKKTQTKAQVAEC